MCQYAVLEVLVIDPRALSIKGSPLLTELHPYPSNLVFEQRTMSERKDSLLNRHTYKHI